MYFRYTRIPRKKKKAFKKFLGGKYSYLTLNQKLWFWLGETNKQHRDYLINQICISYGHNKSSKF